MSDNSSRRADGGGAHAAEFAQLLDGDGFLEVGQDCATRWRGVGSALGSERRSLCRHGQSQGGAGLSELERDMVLGGSGAMFGGQGQLGAFAAHVEIGVAPAVEFAGTAQGLAWAAGVGVFAGVMNQQDGQLKLALQFPEVGEQRGDLGGVVFIDPVQADQRVQDQQDGVEILDGVGRRWRSVGVSKRSEGAVMTSTGREWKATWAARRCLPGAGARRPGSLRPERAAPVPVRRTGNCRRQAVPEATLTATSRARKLLQHLGSPPRMPTA